MLLYLGFLVHHISVFALLALHQFTPAPLVVFSESTNKWDYAVFFFSILFAAFSAMSSSFMYIFKVTKFPLNGEYYTLVPVDCMSLFMPLLMDTQDDSMAWMSI